MFSLLYGGYLHKDEWQVTQLEFELGTDISHTDQLSINPCRALSNNWADIICTTPKRLAVIMLKISKTRKYVISGLVPVYILLHGYLIKDLGPHQAPIRPPSGNGLTASQDTNLSISISRHIYTYIQAIFRLLVQLPVYITFNSGVSFTSKIESRILRYTIQLQIPVNLYQYCTLVSSFSST